MDNFSEKIQLAFDAYEPASSMGQIKSNVTQLLDKHLDHYDNDERLRALMAYIDLTSLDILNSTKGITEWVERVNSFEQDYPAYPMPACICVYPLWISLVKECLLNKRVKVASVVGAFPSAQTFIEVKIAEAALCIQEGVDEADMLIPVGRFVNAEYSAIFDEIAEVKATIGDKKLKVILETGLLESTDLIKKAAVLSMEAGADMLKTSSGKNGLGATIEAAYVMCEAVKEFYEKSGRKVGLKFSGGIEYPQDALRYFIIVGECLGEDWLTPDLFRIGASRLPNALLSMVEGKEITYF